VDFSLKNIQKPMFLEASYGQSIEDSRKKGNSRPLAFFDLIEYNLLYDS
jgi:hypothetical protein